MFVGKLNLSSGHTIIREPRRNGVSVISRLSGNLKRLVISKNNYNLEILLCRNVDKIIFKCHCNNYKMVVINKDLFVLFQQI